MINRNGKKLITDNESSLISTLYLTERIKVSQWIALKFSTVLVISLFYPASMWGHWRMQLCVKAVVAQAVRPNCIISCEVIIHPGAYLALSLELKQLNVMVRVLSV